MFIFCNRRLYFLKIISYNSLDYLLNIYTYVRHYLIQRNCDCFTYERKTNNINIAKRKRKKYKINDNSLTILVIKYDKYIIVVVSQYFLYRKDLLFLFWLPCFINADVKSLLQYLVFLFILDINIYIIY